MSGSEVDVWDRGAARVPWLAVACFIAISFGLAWLASLPIWLSGGPSAPGLSLLIPIVGVVMMFTPTIATIVVMFAFKSPRSERLRALGMWPLRPAKRVVWFIVGAWIAPFVIVSLTVLASVALGLVRLDLVNFSGFQELLDLQTAGLDPAVASTMPPIEFLVLMQLITIPLGSFINAIFAFGEELGWRGWLLPALRPLGLWPALLLHGAIWGLWHSPLILLGYNFDLYDWRGVALMTGGCIAWGVLFGWSRLRSGSVWPAVLGHASLNAVAGLVLLLASSDTPPNMAIVGPLGVVAWAVIAVIVVVLVLSGQFRREPGLAARVVRTQVQQDQQD